MTGIIINDYVVNKRVKLFFLPDDYELVDAQWERSDRILQNLQHLEFFKGRERWCDLSPAHYRLMIAKNLESASFLAEEDRLDDENPVVASLNFLICALVRCIEHSSDCHIESLRINRLGEIDITVEFTAGLSVETSLRSPKGVPPPPKSDPFSVIVDNTKE
jgi:hypothetical protein